MSFAVKHRIAAGTHDSHRPRISSLLQNSSRWKMLLGISLALLFLLLLPFSCCGSLLSLLLLLA